MKPINWTAVFLYCETLMRNILRTFHPIGSPISQPAKVLPPSINRPEISDSIYTAQLAAAQEFLNQNHHADLSHTKCLLRDLMPKEYHDKIEKLKENQVPGNVIFVNGGNNIIATNATKVEQHLSE